MAASTALLSLSISRAIVCPATCPLTAHNASPGHTARCALCHTMQTKDLSDKRFSVFGARLFKRMTSHELPAVSCANSAQKNAHEHTGTVGTLRHSLRKGAYGGKV